MAAETFDNDLDYKYRLSWFQRFLVWLLRLGSIPEHVAFIMDGNRRYAKSLSQKTLHGHREGLEALLRVLAWAGQIGVKEITAYAFSIENFNRSQEEVDGLLDLARNKIPEAISKKSVFNQLGIKVRVLGSRAMLPADLVEKFNTLEKETAMNEKATLNLCFAYTSTQELCDAVNKIAADEEITVEKVEANLYTAGCRPVDLLVRTSGEVRLSDFLLWQARHSILYFARPLWPQFSVYDLLAAVRYYQRYLPAMNRHVAKSAKSN